MHYTYNEANQLETEKTAAGTTYYHHDGCGNTTAKQAAGGTTYLQYNTENLLTRIDFPAGGGHWSYTYNGNSKQVAERTADGYTGFVYQGPDMLALQLERNEAGTTQAHYTIGQGLESVRRSGVSHFYHYNHLGTTIALTASNQTVSDTYDHDAWGVLLFQHRLDREPAYLRGARALLSDGQRRPLPPRLPRLRSGPRQVHDGGPAGCRRYGRTEAAAVPRQLATRPVRLVPLRRECPCLWRTRRVYQSQWGTPATTA